MVHSWAMLFQQLTEEGFYMVCSVTGVVNTWAATVVSFGTEEDSPRALLDSPEAPSFKPDRLAR